MENIKVQTKFDFKALKIANLYVLRVKRKSFLIYLILAAICVAAAVWSIVTGEDTGSKIAFAVVFGLIGALSVYNVFTEEKKIEKSLMKFFAVNPAMTQYVSLSDEKLVLVVPNNGKLEKVTYDWAFVQEINVLNEYYIMFLNGGVPVIIDRSDAAIIEGSQEALAKLIEEKGSMKPYRVYDKSLLKDFSDPVVYVETLEVNLEEVIAKLDEVDEKQEEVQAEQLQVTEEVDDVEETKELEQEEVTEVVEEKEE